MIARCHDPKHDAYPHYGGRGIAVCDRWRESIENFVADMGERPPKMTIDRIDLDGPYSPENCRWATSIEQMNNRTNSVFITYDNRTLTAAQWSKIVGIDNAIIAGRIKHGWSHERALTEPVIPRPYRRKK